MYTENFFFLAKKNSQIESKTIIYFNWLNKWLKIRVESG